MTGCNAKPDGPDIYKKALANEAARKIEKF